MAPAKSKTKATQSKPKPAERETKRDRVRRLLFHPLEELGIEPNPKVKERRDAEGNITATRVERHKDWMNALCDHLGHVADETLIALRETITANPVGSGKAPRKGAEWRGCYPTAIQILDWANRIEPFPLDRVPGLKGWFGSTAGPRALEADLAVETRDWIETHKRPPVHDQDMAAIRRAAALRRDEILRARDRVKRFKDAEAQMAIDRYEYRLAEVIKIIREFRGDKGMLV